MNQMHKIQCLMNISLLFNLDFFFLPQKLTIILCLHSLFF